MPNNDAEYWRQRALEAERALDQADQSAGTPGWGERLKRGAAGAWDATKGAARKAGEAAGQAMDRVEDRAAPLIDRAGEAAGRAGAAIGGAVDRGVGQMEELFLNDLLGREGQGPPPEQYGPPDPLNEAIPPHLRQYYGQEGNWGRPPEPAQQDPGLMERALQEAEKAFNSVMGRRPEPYRQQTPVMPSAPAMPPPGARAPAPGWTPPRPPGPPY